MKNLLAVFIFLSSGMILKGQEYDLRRDTSKTREQKHKEFRENREKDNAKKKEEAKNAAVKEPSDLELPANVEWFGLNKSVKPSSLTTGHYTYVFFSPGKVEDGFLVRKMNGLNKQYPSIKVIGIVDGTLFSSKGELIEALRLTNAEFPVAVFPERDPKFFALMAQSPAVMVMKPTHRKVLFNGNMVQPDGDFLKLYTGLAEPATTERTGKSRQIEHFVRDERLNHFPGPILKNPTSVCFNAETDLMFITDTGNHRILVVDEDGNVIRVIGKKRSGKVDGNFESASFSHPMGIVYHPGDDALYIADTYNHAIRKADLSSNRVTTVLGTGDLGKPLTAKMKNANVDLNFPIGLALSGNELLITMAGTHQLVAYNIITKEVYPMAGNGTAETRVGKPNQTQLHFPVSAVALSSKSIRVVSGKDGAITELTGKKSSLLYEPEKKANPKSKRMFGIAEAIGSTYVSVPELNALYKLEGKQLVPIIESEMGGLAVGAADDARLFRPMGLAARKGKVYIADSFNHLLRVYDPVTGLLSNFEFGDYELAIRESVKPGDVVPVVTADELLLRGSGEVRIEFVLPEGVVFNSMKNNFIEFLKESGNELAAADFNESSMTFTVEESSENLMIYFEAHLHFSDTNFPEVKYFQVVRMLIPLKFGPEGRANPVVKVPLFH